MALQSLVTPIGAACVRSRSPEGSPRVARDVSRAPKVAAFGSSPTPLARPGSGHNRPILSQWAHKTMNYVAMFVGSAVGLKCRLSMRRRRLPTTRCVATPRGSASAGERSKFPEKSCNLDPMAACAASTSRQNLYTLVRPQSGSSGPDCVLYGS